MKVKEIAEYIQSYYKKYNPSNHIYHNMDHIQNVVKYATEIGKACQLSRSQLQVLKIAAWFHDIGHITIWEGHEERSAKIAKEYLTKISYPINKIDMVCKLILATKLHHPPQNLLEEIIKDADLNYLGSDNFINRSELLKSEIEARENRKINYLNWLKINIEFLTVHRFFTDYAIKNFDKIKSENLIKLKKLYSKEKRNN